MTTAAIAASPGKENQSTDLPAKKENALPGLIDSPKTEEDLKKNSQILNENALKTDFATNILFDSLGPSRPLVNALKINLEFAIKEIKKHEENVENGKISLLGEIPLALSITDVLKRLLESVRIVFSKISDGPKVNECLEYLSPSLAELLVTFSKLKLLKIDIRELIIDLCCQILNKIQTTLSAPHDSTLQNLAKFIDACFNSSSPKIRLAVISMWKCTFANSKKLNYPDELRETLINQQKKCNIFLPGISLDQINSALQSRPKKRIMALGEDDSQSFVVIPETKKKMKMTEHQEEDFGNPRPVIPFFNEDSQLFGKNVLAGIKAKDTQFEIDMSMSASTSADKNPAVQKTPQEETVQKQEPTPTTAESIGKNAEEQKDESMIQQNEEPSTESSNWTVVTAKKRRGRPPGSKSFNSRRSDIVKKDVETESIASRRSPRIIQETKKPAQSDCSQDSTEVQVRSRRSQAKGTPSKYVQKGRISRSAKTKVAGNLKEGGTKRQNNSPKNQETTVEKAEEDETEEMLEGVPAEEAPRPAADQSEDVVAEPPIKVEIVEESQNEIMNGMEALEIQIDKSSGESAIQKERIENQQSEVDLLVEQGAFNIIQCTPSKLAESTASPASILKQNKQSTPKNCHVHFFIDEANKKTSGRKTINHLRSKFPPGTRSSLPSKEPLCAALIGNKTPITNIADDITAMKNCDGFHKLRKKLAEMKILTIGEFAAISEATIKLNRLPLAPISHIKSVLEKYIKKDEEKAPEMDTTEVRLTEKSPSRMRFSEEFNSSTVLKNLDISPINGRPTEAQETSQVQAQTPQSQETSQTRESSLAQEIPQTQETSQCQETPLSQEIPQAQEIPREVPVASETKLDMSCLDAAHYLVKHTMENVVDENVQLNKDQIKEMLNKSQKITTVLMSFQGELTKLL